MRSNQPWQWVLPLGMACLERKKKKNEYVGVGDDKDNNDASECDDDDDDDDTRKLPLMVAHDHHLLFP